MSADAGLRDARWEVMRVSSRRPMTVSEVARRLGQKRQSVQRTADGLREQGLAEVLPNVDHARAGLIGLTTAGRRTLEALQRRQKASLDPCLSRVARADMGALALSLADLADRVERATAREVPESGDAAVSRPRRAPSGVKRRLTAA
jgi:DNA-binding MarR family transcriptional regulator